MTRIYLVSAVAATCTEAFFLRYLGLRTTEGQPSFHQENESLVFTNEGVKSIDEAMKVDKPMKVEGGVTDDDALSDVNGAGASGAEQLSHFELLLQSPVVWRGGPSVERSMVRVKDIQDLLPISAAVVMMSNDCAVTEREPKKTFVEALKSLPANSKGNDDTPRSFGKGVLPPWKAVLGFLRRHFGEGERLKVTCLYDAVPAEFAIASKGAVATLWERGGCQKKDPKNLYPSLQAKHLYVPYYTEDGPAKGTFNLFQFDAASSGPTRYLLNLDGFSVSPLTDENDKLNDIVFEQGRVSLLKAGEKPGRKALLVLRAMSAPMEDYSTTLAAPTFDDSGGEIQVIGPQGTVAGGKTIFFAKRRGGWDAQRQQTPVKFVKLTT